MAGLYGVKADDAFIPIQTNQTTMKTNLTQTLLSILGAVALAPLALAGPSIPGGAVTPKAPAGGYLKGKAAACCVTHDACRGGDCGPVARRYASQASGKGVAWTDVRDCNKTCSMNAAEKRAICGKGKGV